MEIEKPLTKVGYHHGNLREALIEAGLKSLAEQGPGNLSLRALAKTLGVSANAVYRHFADKDDWLNAMAAEGFSRFAQAQRDAVAEQSDAGARLMAAGRAYMAFAMHKPALFRLMFDRVTQCETHPELIAASLDALSVLLDCAAAVAQSSPHDEKTKVLAAAAWGMVHGLSELAMGKQLMVLGMDPQVLVERVMNRQTPWLP
jgi:AcrR family transcriptional regulator